MSETSIVVSDYFKCPSCKSAVIEEIQTNVVLSSPLTHAHFSTEEDGTPEEDGTIEIEYGNDVSWDGGEVDRYQYERFSIPVDLVVEIDPIYK